MRCSINSDFVGTNNGTVLPNFNNVNIESRFGSIDKLDKSSTNVEGINGCIGKK
jgi:hypothetical protein